MKPRHLQKLDGVIIPCHLHGLSRKAGSHIDLSGPQGIHCLVSVADRTEYHPVQVRLLCPVLFISHQGGLLVQLEFLQRKWTASYQMGSEIISPSLHFLFGDNYIARIGKGSKENRVGIFQDTFHFRIAYHFTVIQHVQPVHSRQLMRTLQGILDILCRYLPAVLILSRLEIHIIPQLEGILFSIIADLPGSRDRGHDLSQAAVILHQCVTYASDNL